MLLNANKAPQKAALEITATAQRQHGSSLNPGNQAGDMSLRVPGGPPVLHPRGHSVLGFDTRLCKLTRIITVRFVKQSPFGGGSDYSLLL